MALAVPTAVSPGPETTRCRITRFSMIPSHWDSSLNETEGIQFLHHLKSYATDCVELDDLPRTISDLPNTVEKGVIRWRKLRCRTAADTAAVSRAAWNPSVRFACCTHTCPELKIPLRRLTESANCPTCYRKVQCGVVFYRDGNCILYPGLKTAS